MEAKNSDYLTKLRHSCAHLMAAAVMEIWPKTKRAIGPAIDNGFYFDFDFGEVKVTEKELPKIEKKMHEILPTWNSFEKKKLNAEEAKKEYPDNLYKHELINEFSEKGKKPVTFYKSGNYWDLCAGGHVKSPKQEIKYFKLQFVAGAYWRGSEKNKMLTRIYGTVWPTKKELDQYLWQVEEAKKRDHRILGERLNLFVISQTIGRGLPLLTPKGTTVVNEITKYSNQLEYEYGFESVTTPHIARSELYKKTGHWDHYHDTMYAPFGIENEEYVLKPMNCPHHYEIYRSQKRSYRDLPVRLSENGTCYRFEKSGEVTGLLRVRALTIDDAHILMRPDQINDEFKICIEMVAKMFSALSLSDYYVRISLADPSDQIKYIADQSVWQQAGQKLIQIAKENKLKYEVVEGEASFYGPKIDYMVRDSLNREWQMSTLQLDLFMAKRLNLVYTDKQGQDQHPVIIHRGLTGSLERTLGILIEHYAGNFPLWLSPNQVVILPISEKYLVVANKVRESFKQANIRGIIDETNKTLSAKIRDWTLQKVPYLCIIGENEVKAAGKDRVMISVRDRAGKDLGQKEINEFIKDLKHKIEKKA